MKILTHEGLQHFYNQIAAKFSTKEQTAEAIEEAVSNAGIGTVTSVNGKTGVVQLSASDVGALPVSTQIPSIAGLATETYVDNKVASMVDSAPETLNTLNELAAALGDDPNFATTVATEIGGKVSKSGDTMTGNLTIDKSSKAEIASYTVANSLSNISLIALSDGLHGIWDNKKNAMALWANTDNNWVLEGTASGNVNKSGDTMTGALTSTGLSIKSDGWALLRFYNADGAETGGFYSNQDARQLSFFSKDKSGYKDYFKLPYPSGLTADGYYDILTSKNPVTIAQGGTGATNAATARTNLGITPANIGAAPASHSHNHLSASSTGYSGAMKIAMVDQTKSLGVEITGTYSNDDSTAIRLSLRVNKDTGVIHARTDSKAGTFYPDFYTTLNRPTPADIGAAPTVHTHHNLIAGQGNAGELYWHDDFLLSSATRTVPSLHFGTALLYRHDSSASKYYPIYDEGNKPTPAAIGAAPSSHTHSSITYGNASASVGISTTPLLSMHKGGYNHWAMERAGDSDNRLMWHYYDPTTGAWQGNALLIDTNGGTINGAVTINNTLTANKVIGAVYA